MAKKILLVILTLFIAINIYSNEKKTDIDKNVPELYNESRDYYLKMNNFRLSSVILSSIGISATIGSTSFFAAGIYFERYRNLYSDLYNSTNNNYYSGEYKVSESTIFACNSTASIMLTIGASMDITSVIFAFISYYYEKKLESTNNKIMDKDENSFYKNILFRKFSLNNKLSSAGLMTVIPGFLLTFCGTAELIFCFYQDSLGADSGYENKASSYILMSTGSSLLLSSLIFFIAGGLTKYKSKTKENMTFNPIINIGSKNISCGISMKFQEK